VRRVQAEENGCHRGKGRGRSGIWGGVEENAPSSRARKGRPKRGKYMEAYVQNALRCASACFRQKRGQLEIIKTRTKEGKAPTGKPEEAESKFELMEKPQRRRVEPEEEDQY